MFAEDVADILTQKALDALSEFLDVIDVFLFHAPCSVLCVWGPRCERLHPLFHVEVPGYVGNQVFDKWEGAHWFYRYRLVWRQIAHARHAHQFGIAVDFGGTGATFSRLAVPSNRQVICLFGLDAVDGIEDYHAFGDVGFVIDKCGIVCLAAPDSKGCFRHFIPFPL